MTPSKTHIAPSLLQPNNHALLLIDHQYLQLITARAHDSEIAEDTVGSGHSWKLTDDSSRRRAYVVLQPAALVPFRARKRQRATA
jgi:hypothetical protein